MNYALKNTTCIVIPFSFQAYIYAIMIPLNWGNVLTPFYLFNKIGGMPQPSLTYQIKLGECIDHLCSLN